MISPSLRKSRLASVLALLALSMPGDGIASTGAESEPCAKHGILIEATHREDVVDACKAVEIAASFLELAGLALPRDLRIRLLDESSSNLLDVHEIGHYDARRNVVLLRDYRAAVTHSAQIQPAQGALASRDHWRSFIVHELTHAAVHSGCDTACPSRAIHEYVAAVGQIIALPEGERAELLDRHSHLAAFEKESEITEIYYALNPQYFAVKSYKHYRQLSSPQAFLRDWLKSR